jgi:hypothetical protein
LDYEYYTNIWYYLKIKKDKINRMILFFLLIRLIIYCKVKLKKIF